MPINFNGKVNNIDLFSVTQALQDNINYNLNCVKVAKVVEFNAETLTVACRVMNKRLVQLQNDGNQVLEEYPLIYARVHFFGWGDVGATYPIEVGMEGILLFNDRELQTWFLTGDNGNLAYERCHDLTDAIFICGVHSMPYMIQLAEACLNLFYKQSNIAISDEKIITNTKTDEINCEEYSLNCTNAKTEAQNVNIKGLTKITGTLTADGISDTTGASGQFISQDNKRIVVQNGIIKQII